MSAFTVQQAIAKIIGGEHLLRGEARDIMSEIMDGQATPSQIASLATALRMKGETSEEITGFAESMRSKASRVQTVNENLLDAVGTGGDGSNTFNISTASAIVAAAGGIRVAKHGNRAASSKTGSADVLEALGVNIQLNNEQAARCLDQVGICFMFAQVFHQSMKHAAIPRKEIGIRTIFNLLGPLTNPAGADLQLLGVSDRNKTELMAEVIKSLGLKRGMVVSSHDGLDEISISAPTRVTELKDGVLRTYDITPDELGLRAAGIEAVKGGDAQTNAGIIRSIFNGDRGAYRDIVLANAGACFYVAGRCSTLQEGVKLAASVIDMRLADDKLQQLIACTGELSHVS
ncbi:anthranilate phosphoribosyltransferase [Paenibacillus contaminans]|uniref:Anthranilate phosphoribosyltransferase n=1 Tax=Paenibacillus contaminans TaxID=450362 RepID=A0A329MKX3_9BACL|nr:anthranilate phosphoribosyltransferase [Paenibacillus contaminans]RAV18517.1 anthranilate phosphoribosyltransferase [Paenibacillus contaminans]